MAKLEAFLQGQHRKGSLFAASGVGLVEDQHVVHQCEKMLEVICEVIVARKELEPISESLTLLIAEGNVTAFHFFVALLLPWHFLGKFRKKLIQQSPSLCRSIIVSRKFYANVMQETAYKSQQNVIFARNVHMSRNRGL